MAHPFVFACPLCQGPLAPDARDALRCPADGEIYQCVDGIWRFLPRARQEALSRFVSEYETIRQAEARGGESPSYYRALPDRDETGTRSEEWRVRALSFRTLVGRIIAPLEGGAPLRILDLGAGNGWLSNRLAERGHALAAVDLSLSPYDGLGAHAHYETSFLSLEAEFDRLPLAADQVDLAIFNASLHYSPSIISSLREAERVIVEGGQLIVVDTPVYHDGRSGQQMVRERQASFRQRYGFPSDAQDSENFLTYQRLEELAGELGMEMIYHWPAPAWRWTIRRVKDRLRGRREPAQFPIVTFRK